LSSQGTAIELTAALNAAAAATSAYPQNEPGEPSEFLQQKQSQQSSAPTVHSIQQQPIPGTVGASNTLPHSHTWNPQQQYPVAGFPSFQSLDMQAQAAAYPYYPLPAMLPSATSLPFGLSSPGIENYNLVFVVL
jgi:hypothetical protein